MAKRTGGLFVNRFELVTRNNYNVATYLFKQHVDSLYGDSQNLPITLTCYNRAKSKYDIYQAAHNAQTSQSNTQGGKVFTMANTLKGMSLHVSDWEAKIKAVYPVTTERYKILFKTGVGIFTKGSQQKRVDAVQALLTNIGTDATLTAVKGIIQTFYDGIIVSYNTKDNSKKTTKSDSLATETARINMCQVMEGNYGLLLDEFQEDPTLASKYFDEAYMQNTLQMSFDLKIKPLCTKKGIKRTFKNPITQQFQIDNRSNTSLKVFLSLTKYGLVGLVSVTVPPLGTGIYDLIAMGDNTTHKFLNILNTDDKLKADVTIKVL